MVAVDAFAFCEDLQLSPLPQSSLEGWMSGFPLPAPLSPHMPNFAEGSDGEVIRAARSLVWARDHSRRAWCDCSPTCWLKRWDHDESLHPRTDLWKWFSRLEFNVDDWHGLATRTCACVCAYTIMLFMLFVVQWAQKKTHQHVLNVTGRVVLTDFGCNDVIGMSSSTTLSPHKPLVHHFSPIDPCVFPMVFHHLKMLLQTPGTWNFSWPQCCLVGLRPEDMFFCLVMGDGWWLQVVDSRVGRWYHVNENDSSKDIPSNV